MMTSDNILQ